MEFLSSISNHAQAKIRKLYEEAITHQPSIIIIDDLDCIASQKDSTNKEGERKVVFQLANSLEAVSGVRMRVTAGRGVHGVYELEAGEA